jgi:hypothetical protein
MLWVPQVPLLTMAREHHQRQHLWHYLHTMLREPCTSGWALLAPNMMSPMRKRVKSPADVGFRHCPTALASPWIYCCKGPCLTFFLRAADPSAAGGFLFLSFLGGFGQGGNLGCCGLQMPSCCKAASWPIRRLRGPSPRIEVIWNQWGGG